MHRSVSKASAYRARFALRTPVACAVILGGTLAAGTSPVAASQDTVLVPATSDTTSLGAPGADGVVRWSFDRPLLNGRSEWRRGVHEGDGCRFPGSASGTPNVSGVTLEREIAFDPATCLVQVEIGNGSLQTATGDTGDRKDATDSVRGGRKPQNGVTAQSEFLTGAFAKTYYEDPPQIDVTTVQVNVEWTYNGTCVVGNTYHTAD